MQNDPLSSDKLTNIFRTSTKDPLRIINREGTTIEFKESYNHAGMAQYFKTIAAFANNSGGYIIFGVGENPRRLIGLKGKNLTQFEELKVEEFTKNLMDYFSPEIKWDHVTFEFKGMSFGVIYTKELEKKPCICKKNYDDKNTKYSLKESDIYYRYGGRSERIKYDELYNIIETERKREEEQWMEFIKKAAKLGIENAGLLDLESGVVFGKGGSVIIDESIVNKISFIKEGEFVERGGKPTLRVIGDVQNIDSGKVIVKEKTKKVVNAIGLDEIMNAFLENLTVDEPMEYIKGLCASAASANYPIYYYIRQAHSSIDDSIQAIEQITMRGSTKKYLLQRLKGKLIERQAITYTNTEASNKKHKYMQQWLDNKVDIIQSELKYCVQALFWLTEIEIKKNDNYIKQILSKIYKEYYESADSTLASDIRRAVCRIDEVLYLI